MPDLSRVQLEPMLRRAVAIGHTDEAAAIRAELASRTWQHTNPYAGSVPAMTTTGNDPNDLAAMRRAARLNLARDAWDDALDRGDVEAADRLEAEVAALEARDDG